MNTFDAIRAWVTYREKLVDLGLVARSTLENQTAIALKLADELGGLQLDALRKSHIELWMGARLQTCAPVTVRGELNVLRQMLNWWVDEAMLLAKPRLPTLSVPSTEAALPSDEAFLWVLANVPANHAAALEFMMLTGLSPHELERVQVRDLGGSAGAVLFIGQRPDFAVKQASRRRDIPLNARASDLWFAATAGRNSTMTVFPTVAAMQKAIRRALLPCGRSATYPVAAEQITPKLMRKWFASKVSNDQPEHVLQRLLGHAPGSPITRRHYVRSTDDQGAQAVGGIGI